jgi:hypothetical protein
MLRGPGCPDPLSKRREEKEIKGLYHTFIGLQAAIHIAARKMLK